jgi:hypothetical protein
MYFFNYSYRAKIGMHRRRHKAHPETAMEKIKLRLQIARKIGRLDLSSKACWPEDDIDDDDDNDADAASQSSAGTGSVSTMTAAGAPGAPGSAAGAQAVSKSRRASISKGELTKRRKSAVDEQAVAMANRKKEREEEMEKEKQGQQKAEEKETTLKKGVSFGKAENAKEGSAEGGSASIENKDSEPAKSSSSPSSSSSALIVSANAEPEGDNKLTANGKPKRPRILVIDASEEQKKLNVALAVEAAAAVSSLTLASAFVQGEAVVRKIVAADLPTLDLIASIGGKQNPFVRMSLKSTGERALTAAMTDPGKDCTWDLLDLYLGGAFITAKRLQMYRGRKAVVKKQASTGSVTSVATTESSIMTPVDDTIEHVLEVEVLNDSVIVPDALIGVASAPLPNVPIGTIGMASLPDGQGGEEGGAENSLGMAQWRLELSLDLKASLAEDAAPAGNLSLVVEVPAASDNIPDSVINIPFGVIVIKKIAVYDLEMLANADGAKNVSKVSKQLTLSLCLKIVEI